jgi:iron complex transport system ATP-binding protein
MDASPPLLSLAGVGARLGARDVLAGVTATVRAGELVAIVGPNGAGKTTLLRLLGGLLAPSAGQVRAFGVAPSDGAARRALARQLAYVPQQYRLAFAFSVREVVAMGCTARRLGPWLDDAEDDAAIDAAIDRFALRDLARRSFEQLSGGEQRRVLLAQAACQGATAWLLDEPTAALDPAHAREVVTALRAQVDGGAHAVVMVTHDLNLALATATTMWLVDRGRLARVGPPAEVLASPELAAAFAVGVHLGTAPDGQPFVVTTGARR